MWQFIGIFYSSDYGINWIASNAPSSSGYSWFGISSDSTGQYVVAAGNRSSIFTSSTFGRTWIEAYTPTVSQVWNSVAFASNAKLVAAASAYIFVDDERRLPSSEPTGQPSYTFSSILKFSKSLGSPGTNWISTHSDSTSEHIVAAQEIGFIYTSTSYGETWDQKTSDAAASWGAVGISGDGMILVGVQWFGFVYIRYLL